MAISTFLFFKKYGILGLQYTILFNYFQETNSKRWFLGVTQKFELNVSFKVAFPRYKILIHNKDPSLLNLPCSLSELFCLNIYALFTLANAHILFLFGAYWILARLKGNQNKAHLIHFLSTVKYFTTLWLWH